MTDNGLVSLSVEVMTPTGIASKKTIKFKSFEHIPIGLLRSTRKTPGEQVWKILEWACDAKALEIVDQMASNKLDDLIVEMQKASRVDLGESSGSSTTSTMSRSTASRSKRTLSTKV
jgi:hypothetical protein